MNTHSLTLSITHSLSLSYTHSLSHTHSHTLTCLENIRLTPLERLHTNNSSCYCQFHYKFRYELNFFLGSLRLSGWPLGMPRTAT